MEGEFFFFALVEAELEHSAVCLAGGANWPGAESSLLMFVPYHQLCHQDEVSFNHTVQMFDN